MKNFYRSLVTMPYLVALLVVFVGIGRSEEQSGRAPSPYLMKFMALYSPSHGTGLDMSLGVRNIGELAWMPIESAAMHSAYYSNYVEYGAEGRFRLLSGADLGSVLVGRRRYGVFEDINFHYQLMTLAIESEGRFTDNLAWMGHLGVPVSKTSNTNQYDITAFDSEAYYLAGLTWYPWENRSWFGLHSNCSNGLINVGVITSAIGPIEPISLVYNLQRNEWLVGLLRPPDK